MEIARMPLVRIQGVQHGFTVASQLRQRMETAGFASGNFRYVKVDRSICDVLDQDMVDFAVHLEAAPAMGLFATPEMRDTYGWPPVAPNFCASSSVKATRCSVRKPWTRPSWHPPRSSVEHRPPMRAGSPR